MKNLFRNFQPVGLFCSLNLGVSGLISDQPSLDYLRENHKMGDIIEVVVQEDFDFAERLAAGKALIALSI